MKIKLLFLAVILAACGGSTKPNVSHPIVVTNIRASTHEIEISGIYCKYIGRSSSFSRPYRFIDTCGKFKVGDTVFVNFYKKNKYARLICTI